MKKTEFEQQQELIAEINEGPRIHERVRTYGVTRLFGKPVETLKPKLKECRSCKGAGYLLVMGGCGG